MIPNDPSKDPEAQAAKNEYFAENRRKSAESAREKSETQPAAAPSTKAAGSKASKKAAGPALASQETNQASGATDDEGNFESVVLQLANKYAAEPQVFQLVELALALPSLCERPQLFARPTPVVLLLAAIYQGKAKPDFHGDCAFLATCLANRSSLTEDSFMTYLGDSLESSVRTAENTQAGASGDLPTLTDETFGFAAELGERAAGERKIGMHHLLATILLLLPGWGTQADIPLLQYSNLSIADLAQQFLLYVLRTYPTEGSQAWESEFNRVFGTQQPSPPGNRKKPEPAPVEAPKAEPVRIGTELNINRVATGEEVCLATKDYVQALGLLFQREKNTEFCFALFGHWGRGKTFLMDELAGVLKKAKYETVRFSVWQYPKAPEVWVSLYETFARAAYPNNPLISLPRIFRASVAKTGIWPVFAALAGLVLAAWWPREAQAPTASTHLSWLTLLVGSFSVAYVGGVLAIIQQTVARLRKNYLTATRHSENLGLQATIGEDLKALITGWMPGEEFPTSLGTTCSLIAVLGTATGVAWHLINGGTTRANDILFVVLVVIASLLVAWLFFPGKVPARVLLVVDDLDRCSFGQLLSVIESIKLLVEDPKVSARVQVAMLVEEDILGHAILEKYAGLLKPDPPRTVVQAFSESRVLRENREKLFSAYLRLPRLSKEEIEEVLSRFGRKSASQADSARQADSPVPPTGGAAGTASSISQAARSAESPVQPRVGGPTASPTKDIPTPAQGGSPQGAAHGSASAEANAGPRLEIRLESLALGETEKQYLIEAIRAVRAEAVSADDPVGEWGPRSVRSLCFRYQLARLLLKRPNEELEPSQLRELAFEMVNASVGKSRSDSQIGRVASLVA